LEMKEYGFITNSICHLTKDIITQGSLSQALKSPMEALSSL
jgi:hypothetical protein